MQVKLMAYAEKVIIDGELREVTLVNILHRLRVKSAEDAVPDGIEGIPTPSAVLVVLTSDSSEDIGSKLKGDLKVVMPNHTSTLSEFDLVFGKSGRHNLRFPLSVFPYSGPGKYSLVFNLVSPVALTSSWDLLVEFEKAN